MRYTTYTNLGLEFVELSTEQKEFLKGYKPASQGVTSKAEMNDIVACFGLNESVPLRAIRNAVVEFYHILMDTLDRATEAFWAAMDALQSVVAVIDYKMYLK